jgi:hypothetical protein
MKFRSVDTLDQLKCVGLTSYTLDIPQVEAWIERFLCILLLNTSEIPKVFRHLDRDNYDPLWRVVAGLLNVHLGIIVRSVTRSMLGVERGQ